MCNLCILICCIISVMQIWVVGLLLLEGERKERNFFFYIFYWMWILKIQLLNCIFLLYHLYSQTKENKKINNYVINKMFKFQVFCLNLKKFDIHVKNIRTYNLTVRFSKFKSNKKILQFKKYFNFLSLELRKESKKRKKEKIYTPSIPVCLFSIPFWNVPKYCPVFKSKSY